MLILKAMGTVLASCPNSQIGCVAKGGADFIRTAFFYALNAIDKPAETGEHQPMNTTTLHVLIRRMSALPAWLLPAACRVL